MSNALYICNLWSQVLFWKIQYPLGHGWLHLPLWSKEILYSEKNFCLRLNTVTYEKKTTFLGTTTLLWATVFFSDCSSLLFQCLQIDSANTDLFIVNSRNTRKRCKICPKSTINTVENGSGVFIVNFEHISHFLVFLLLALNG